MANLWEPKRRIEKEYNQTLQNASKQMTAAVRGISDPLQLVRVLRKIAAEQRFHEFAESTAMKMVTSLFSDTGKTWREAARINTKDKEIYEAIIKELENPLVKLAISEQIESNARLIRTLPSDLADEFALYIQQESLKGRRASDIAKDLEKRVPARSRARVNLIARTETSKASTALTRVRSEALGIDWYIWRTSEDARVRSSHGHMHGVLIKWTNPPAPEELVGLKGLGNYHAGNIYNCRCYPEPIVNLSNLRFPRKVYTGGRVQRLTKSQFMRIM